MQINDLRLLSKEDKKNLVDNYSAEFAYVLSKKINQPVYQAKRNKKIKYFVDHFNMGCNNEEIFVVDVNRQSTVKKESGYQIVDLFEEGLNEKLINFFEKELSSAYIERFSRHVNNYEIIYFENEIYNSDLPFRRDILIVKKEGKIIASCYVTGLSMRQEDVRKFSSEDIEKIINSNSDCRRLSNKFECHYDLLENYLLRFFQHNFIDSVVVEKESRGLGIATMMYEMLFEHYNNEGEIRLTSCQSDIQTEDAKKLWDRLKEKHTQKYREHDGFCYLDFS